MPSGRVLEPEGADWPGRASRDNPEASVRMLRGRHRSGASNSRTLQPPPNRQSISPRGSGSVTLTWKPSGAPGVTMYAISRLWREQHRVARRRAAVRSAASPWSVGAVITAGWQMTNRSGPSWTAISPMPLRAAEYARIHGLSDSSSMSPRSSDSIPAAQSPLSLTRVSK
jgi:hypothetical protein